jgi:hypothetical protein
MTCAKLLFVFLLFSAWGAVHPEERWYLIQEQELGSIEAYRKNSGAEKQAWLLQAQGLRLRAESLEAESRSLNAQLQDQRELNRKLTLSFSEYEAAQSLLMSRKDTRIVQLETENEGKGKVIFRLIIAAALLGLGLVIPIAVKIAMRL